MWFSGGLFISRCVIGELGRMLIADFIGIRLLPLYEKVQLFLLSASLLQFVCYYVAVVFVLTVLSIFVLYFDLMLVSFDFGHNLQEFA